MHDFVQSSDERGKLSLMETLIISSRKFDWYTPGEYPVISGRNVHASTSLSDLGLSSLPLEFIVKSERTGEHVHFELNEAAFVYASDGSTTNFYTAFGGAAAALSPRYLRISVHE